MTNVFRFFVLHKVLTAITLLLVVIVGLGLLTRTFDYNKLNEADMLNVYYKDDLVAVIENPSSVLGIVEAIYITSPKQLGLSPFRMKELYVLEYISNDKTISRISIITPRNDKAIATLEKKSNQSEWNRLNGECVIMRNQFCYFSFGKNFYTKLSEIVAHR